MDKIKITLEIESKHRNERRVSKLEKLVNSFIRLWKVTLASDLPPNAKNRFLRQILVSGTLLALAYLMVVTLTFVLNHP